MPSVILFASQFRTINIVFRIVGNFRRIILSWTNLSLILFDRISSTNFDYEKFIFDTLNVALSKNLRKIVVGYRAGLILNIFGEREDNYYILIN